MFKNYPRVSGIATGLGVTLLCVVYFLVLNREHELELIAFDYRVRECSALGATTPIVHVDIDDNSLERVGRWPWHRHQLGGIIRALSELGAEVIAVDLVLSEPQRPFIDHPGLTHDMDRKGGSEVIGSISDQNVVWGDLELGAAIRDAGNVFLPAHMDIRLFGQPEDDRDRLRRLRQGNPDITPAEAIAALQKIDTPSVRSEIANEILRLRMEDALREDFTATNPALSALLGMDEASISAVVAGVKRKVAEEHVGRLFATGRPALDEVLASVLGDRKDRSNPDRADVEAAHFKWLGLKVLEQFIHPLGSDVGEGWSRAVSVIPPHYKLARHAKDVGAVNFRTDARGGTRRIPLMIKHGSQGIKHLSFSVARHILDLDCDRITVSENNVLTIPRRDGSGSIEIPLDAAGNLIINWTRTARGWRTGKDFPHISAAKVWALVEIAGEIKHNKTAIAYAYSDVIAVSKGEIEVQVEGGDANETVAIPADSLYRNKVNECLSLKRELHLGGLRGDWDDDAAEAEGLRGRIDALDRYIAREQETCASVVEQACSEIAEIPEEELDLDPELRRDVEAYQRALKIIKEDIAGFQAANQQLERRMARLRVELSEKIKGKYVFLGHAATAEGDVVMTPIDPRTIGVMCHAQALNSILQNRFITRAGQWTECAICLGLGLLVCIITAVRGPRFALLATLGIMLGYMALNAFVVFRHYGVWLSLAPNLITIAATWAVVTLFRQLTAEREKRFFAKQLSQYTAPAIAKRIAESPEAAKAFKTVQTREMTCFFSDLRGFTTITEEEDAEVIQYVLNTYLERMSKAIWPRHGLINKFMGDGIMAFFNPSVDPFPDHARAGCEAGLGVFDALEALKIEQKTHPASSVFDKLRMRVGIASGLCKNGDFGSDLKADYTVIGDVVNLAARLEPANKAFGTEIMVSGAVRDVVADLYEFRYLAELRVKGKTHTVPAYELVCCKGDLSDAQRAYIDRFEEGVRLYRQRKWDECIVHFTRMLARKFDDLGASCYIDACQELKAFPPDEDWNGAVEMKEK